jgi:glutathionylspermidine synthase
MAHLHGKTVKLAAPPILAAAPAPLFTIAPALDRADFANLKRAMALRFCKWDPQVSDTTTLAPFPLILSRACRAELSHLATRLAVELYEAEAELLHCPKLHRHLGIPWRIRRCLGKINSATPSPRLLRFDFHRTPDGWRISEVNADVPGGFTESSSFPRLISRHYPGHQPVGDVAAAWTGALLHTAAGQTIALLSAPGFMEDHQITNYLAMRIREASASAICITPKQIQWRDRRIVINNHEIGLLLRFYQAEWLPSFGRSSGWQNFFDSQTPISNPTHSILAESKRLPLIWDDLKVDVPTWRRLLPPTHDPRHLSASALSDSILKSAYCNNGDSIASSNSPQWRKSLRHAWWRPGQWVAQRRFEILPIVTPLGPMYPCLGVYVLDGEAIGIYGRISATPIIDHTAIDIAVLLNQRGGAA